MTEKGEEMGGGGARERESMLSFGNDLWWEEKKGWGVGVDSTLEKEEGFQFLTSQGMNGKTGVPGEKPISQM